MELITRTQEGVLIVKVPSEVDSGNAVKLQEAVGKLLGQDKQKLVFDFSDNEYVSTAGIRVFLDTLNKLKSKQGKMAMFAINEVVFEVFDITGFTEVFGVVDDEAAALLAVK